MKKAIILIALILSATACHQAYQHSAEQLAAHYLDSLRGPANYQVIAFDTLREYRPTWEQATAEGRAMDSLKTIYVDSAAHDISNTRLLDTISRLITTIKNNNANYTAQTTGAALKTTIHLKTPQGNWQTDTTYFIFDTDVTHIIKTYPL